MTTGFTSVSLLLRPDKKIQGTHMGIYRNRKQRNPIRVNKTEAK